MSSFVVSARKYRPVKFEDVVGQEHVVQTLKNAIIKDKLAHAFLFCGPRGVGKTSCARILAKTVNCLNSKETGEACGSCAHCKIFAEQQTFNIIELDAASYNSVDHIRSLNDQVRFQPQQGQYKVFIIDEVHMLSQSAFNAFLKTLEEPPPYAIFILATTEKHKILPTILSRCQIFDFKRIPIPQIVEHLRFIAQEEHLTVEDEALHIIAQKSDGALRDSLSIFDRLVSFTDGQLTYQGAINNLNVLDYDYYFRIVDSLMLEDYAQIFMTFDEILKNGFEPDHFLLGLAEHLRMLLVSKDQRTHTLMELSESLKVRYLQQARQTPLTLLLSGLQIANECDIHYPKAKNKRLHVEMALLKMSHIHKIKDVDIAELSVEKKTIDQSDAHAVFDLPHEGDEEKLEEASIDPETIDQNKTNTKTVSNISMDSSSTSPENKKSQVDVAEPINHSNSTEDPKPTVAETVNTEESEEIITIPRLNSLQNIQKAILNDDTKQVEKLPFDQETVQKLWNDYSSQLESKSVKKVLNQTELKVEDKRITALVGTQFAKGVIVQESSLIENLRYKTNRYDIQLVIEIDPSLAPDELQSGRKIMTNKEKYEAMCASNPLVKDFIETLNLKVDHSI